MKRSIRAASALGALSLAVAASGFAGIGTSGASVSHTTVDTSGVVLNVGDISSQQVLPLVTSGEITSTGTKNSAGNLIYTVAGFPFKVTFNEFAAGPEAIAGILGGSIDLALTADTPVIFAQEQNIPLKVVATALPTYPGADFAIVLPKGSKIKKIADLKGKTISAQSSTINQYFALAALKSAKLSPKDVTIDNLTPLNALAALNGGSLDAAVIPQPFVDLATLGGATVLTTAKGYVDGYAFLDASNSALASKAKTAAIGDYLTLLAAAGKWTKAHATSWVNTVASNYHIPVGLASVLVKNTQASYVQIGSKVQTATQAEANVFYADGYLAKKITVKSEFSTVFNSIVAKLG